MTSEEFLRIVDELHKEDLRILNTKGIEYTKSGDRLDNFKVLEPHVHKYDMWLVYAYKHWVSIMNFCKNKQVLSEESIHGRIHDLRNYLALLEALVIEDEHSLYPK